jgi:hypothetical protein
MKSKVGNVMASLLLFAGCNDDGNISREDYGGHFSVNSTLAQPKNMGESAYDIFLKSRAGKIRFETVHGPFSDLEACQTVLNAYENRTIDARLPGVYNCERISGAMP